MALEFLWNSSRILLPSVSLTKLRMEKLRNTSEVDGSEFLLLTKVADLF